jgi:hypothetical protein
MLHVSGKHGQSFLLKLLEVKVMQKSIRLMTDKGDTSLTMKVKLTISTFEWYIFILNFILALATVEWFYAK